LLPLLLVTGVLCCAGPQPRAPEEIARRAQNSKSRGLVERLQLPPKKARKAARILERLRREFATYEAARLKLLDEVLEQVIDGELSRERLAPLGETTVSEFDRALPALAVALNDVHALLSAKERGRLVQIYGSDDAKQSDAERRAERQNRLGRVLDLSVGQKTRLYAAWLGLYLKHLGFIREFRADIKDAKSSFLSDEFDVNSLALMKNPRFGEVLELIYEALAVTLPVLSDAQRRSLAAYMDAAMRGV
jgi:hypothetical protein